MKIFVAGDFCPQHRVTKAFNYGDFGAVLAEVRPVISQAEYSIVNYECPVCLGVEKPIEKCGPNLKSTERGIEAVKWAGFNCVTLANNHFLDYGEEGVRKTIETLTKYGIDYVGGGMNLHEASQILYKDIAGSRLAIVNCCEHEFSIATASTAGCNPLNVVQQCYAIKEARANADYVLIIVHGGHEHFRLPSPRMVETYRFFVDAGADAVVNHHQHCYSGYELYNGKPIFYGIGNFCFDNPSKRSGIWTEGYAITIDFDGNAPTFDIHPYKQCGDNPVVNMLPQNAYNKRLAELHDIIVTPDKLKEVVNRYYDDCCSHYGDIFEPITNRFYLGAKRRGFVPSLINKKKFLIAYDFVLCESHKDKLRYWFENNNTIIRK